MKKKKITISNLLMFIKMTVLGLRANPRTPGIGEFIENIFNETFDKKLVD